MSAPYKLEHHSFTGWRICNWQVCTKCGLMRLKNPLTDEAIRLGCNHTDHPNWKQTVSRLTQMEAMA